jgi:hypothetical protein
VDRHFSNQQECRCSTQSFGKSAGPQEAALLLVPPSRCAQTGRRQSAEARCRAAATRGAEELKGRASRRLGGRRSYLGLSIGIGSGLSIS